MTIYFKAGYFDGTYSENIYLEAIYVPETSPGLNNDIRL